MDKHVPLTALNGTQNLVTKLLDLPCSWVLTTMRKITGADGGSVGQSSITVVGNVPVLGPCDLPSD